MVTLVYNAHLGIYQEVVHYAKVVPWSYADNGLCECEEDLDIYNGLDEYEYKYNIVSYLLYDILSW